MHSDPEGGPADAIPRTTETAASLLPALESSCRTPPTRGGNRPGAPNPNSGPCKKLMAVALTHIMVSRVYFFLWEPMRSMHQSHMDDKCKPNDTNNSDRRNE